MANNVIGYSDIERQPRHHYGSGKKPNPKTFVSYNFGPHRKPIQITLKKEKIEPNVENGKLEKVTCVFKLNNKPYRFNVYTNLPNIFGMSVRDALHSWVYRTRKYTARSFCEYIKGKDTNFIALTETEFKALPK